MDLDELRELIRIARATAPDHEGGHLVRLEPADAEALLAIAEAADDLDYGKGSLDLTNALRALDSKDTWS